METATLTITIVRDEEGTSYDVFSNEDLSVRELSSCAALLTQIVAREGNFGLEGAIELVTAEMVRSPIQLKD